MDGGKDFVKFATNPNFVQIIDYTEGLHKLEGNAGDGYRITKGRTPRVYYISYVTPEQAEKLLLSWTGIILGRQMGFHSDGTIKFYQYFVRTYKIMLCFEEHHK
jgi:hypothetical protein